MKYEIKKIDLWTTARFSGLFYGLIGLVPMLFALAVSLSQAFSGNFSFEILMFLLFPLGFFVAGFIVGLLFALIYNRVAEEWGGIKMEIDYHEDR